MKIRELYSDESRWTKNAFARDASGNEVSSRNSTAVCWCVGGAFNKCYPTFDNESIDERVRVREKLEAKLGGCVIVSWNDDPKRTFAEVKALVEELDI